MWFRNLQIYRLPGQGLPQLERFDDALSRKAFQGCGGLERQSLGWLPPREGGLLVHTVERHGLLALGVEQKLLPAAVVNQTAAERAREIERQQGFTLGRKALRELKEQIADELLPRAFAQRRTIWVWLDPDAGWLGIDAASPNRAEMVVELLGKCLDDFYPQRLQCARSPQAAMTDWLLAGEAPAGFSIDRDCELRAIAEERSSVRYTRHALDGEAIETEIRAHLAAGKLPVRLAMTWNDRISFVLTEKLELKRLAFLDLLKESLGKQEDADAEFDAGFALMAGELARMLADLTDALGGAEPQE